MSEEREVCFELSPPGEATCAVVSVTPPEEAHTHTYYDVCPWSPSGRYLVSLRLPVEDRRPGPAEVADLCLIDLEARTIRTVWRTTAWGYQTAAHQLWGRTDRYLYFNDRRDGRPAGVRLDLETGQATWLDGTIWLIAPDESYAISPCLIRCNLTQFGYGLSVDPADQLCNTQRAAADDGFYRTDLATGRRTLLVSLADVWEALPNKDQLAESILYAFHCKLNPQGTRMILVVRAWYPDRKYLPMLLSCRPDGTDLRCVLPSHRWVGGAGSGHPGWHPDGEKILMNHAAGGRQRKLCLIDPITGQADVLTELIEGTGHPTIEPSGRLLVTDDYQTKGDLRLGTIRLVDLAAETWRDLCTLSSPLRQDAPLRCDSHPAWDRKGRRVCFIAAPRGKRQLFIADPASPPGNDLNV